MQRGTTKDKVKGPGGGGWGEGRVKGRRGGVEGQRKGREGGLAPIHASYTCDSSQNTLAGECDGCDPLQQEAQQLARQRFRQCWEWLSGSWPKTYTLNKQDANSDYSQPIRPQHVGA